MSTAPLPLRDIKVPGILVDTVVVADADAHWQTFAERFNPAYVADTSAALPELPSHPLDARKVIARRAALELRPGDIVNLGIGLPEAVAPVAAEEGIMDDLVLTVETGAIGGVPAGGLSFGASYMPTALIDAPYMFDFLRRRWPRHRLPGGGPDRRPGQCQRQPFRSRDAWRRWLCQHQPERQAGRLLRYLHGRRPRGNDQGRRPARIRREGRQQKLVRQVEQVTFNGAFAQAAGRPVLYVTERAVFTLTSEGLTLTELAPGVDLERDVLAQMAFRPHIEAPLRPMDPRLFRPEPMRLPAV